MNVHQSIRLSRLFCLRSPHHFKSLQAKSTGEANDNVKKSANNVTEAGVKKRKKTLRKNEKSFPVIGHEASKFLMKKLQLDLGTGDTIVEMCPGPGIFTQMLVEQIDNKIVLLEPRQNYREELSSKFGDRVIISNLDMRVLNYKSSMKNSFIDMFPVQEQGDRSNVRLVGAVANPSFFYNLILSIVLEESIFKKNYPTFYHYMNDDEYKLHFSDFPFTYNKKMKTSLLYQFFFDVTKLDVEQITETPPHGDDPAIHHLVKLEPCWSLLDQFQRNERWYFYHFLSATLGRLPNQNFVFDALREFLPTIGEQLIDVGFQVNSYSQDLQKDEIFYLYHTIRSLPSFEDSNFKQSALKKISSIKKLSE